MRRIFRRYSAAGSVLVAAVVCAACGSAANPPDPLEVAVARLVDGDHMPGAQAVVTGDGKNRVVARGFGDVAAGVPFADDARVRIGSNTKTFVATVMLQLVAEGRVALDSPVEQLLPGVVRGRGIDGTRITLRNLLQHTSGLPDYTDEPEFDSEDARYTRYEPGYLVHAAVRKHPAHFAPGDRWEYSNTNYVLVGMIIERLTGQPVRTEVTRRIIDPLGLTATTFPAPGEMDLPRPHPVGYLEIDGKKTDFTTMDTSWAGAAGAMISTGADLNRFLIALLAGKLLPPAQLAEMQRTVPAESMSPGFHYGLGLARVPVSCGKEVWGHGGSILGYRTRNGATPDGRAVTVTVNQHPSSDQVKADMLSAVDAALCAP